MIFFIEYAIESPSRVENFIDDANDEDEEEEDYAMDNLSTTTTTQDPVEQVADEEDSKEEELLVITKLKTNNNNTSNKHKKTPRTLIKVKSTAKRKSNEKNNTDTGITCDQCGLMCASRTLLASHRYRKHRTKPPTYSCEKCGRGFETRKKLEKHQTRATCQVYPEFVCEFCNKKFIGRSNYNIHLRFHKKQYPFVCHVCGKGFMLASHLNCHVKTKHEHQRFVCEQPDCGKMFQTSHSLKMHAYVHTGGKPYQCEYCARMYPTKGRLRWHITHSHGIDHTLEELDRMLVAEKLSIRTEMKSVNPKVEEN